MYSALRTDGPRKEFRLLKLKGRRGGTSGTLSNEENGIPICELRHTFRDEPYETLSYVWGDESNPRLIRVNGEDFQVTSQLRTAIEYLQKEDSDVDMWIDAVCIWQSNIPEKTSQVGQMTNIYAESQRTVVWLGEEADGSDAMIKACNEIGVDLVRMDSPAADGELESRSILESMIDLATSTINDDEGYKVLSLKVNNRLSAFFDKAEADLASTLTLLTATQKLLDRPYWNRVWIRQEFVVSSKVEIQCGNLTTPATYLQAWLLYTAILVVHLVAKLNTKLIDMMSDSSPHTGQKIRIWLDQGCPEFPDTDLVLAKFNTTKDHFFALSACAFPKSTVNLFGMRRRYHNASDPDTLTLLQILSKVHLEGIAQCKDSRDRIFAMVQMASDREDLAITPNYHDDYDAVYSQAARAMIALGHVDLLSFAQNRPIQGSPPEQPAARQMAAWVPDWSRPLLRPCGQVPWDTFFSASGNIPWSRDAFQDANYTSQVDLNQVYLRGWLVDTIESLGSAWIPDEENYRQDFTKQREYLFDIARLCDLSNAKLRISGAEIYVNLADRVDAHQRVPVADQEEYGMGFIRRSTDATIAQHGGALRDIEKNVLSEGGLGYLNMMGWQRFRKPFLSEKGYVGLVPDHAEINDILVIFEGGKFPYVLRRAPGTEGHSVFVGETYIHGIMYGEFLSCERVAGGFILE